MLATVRALWAEPEQARALPAPLPGPSSENHYGTICLSWPWHIYTSHLWHLNGKQMQRAFKAKSDPPLGANGSKVWTLPLRGPNFACSGAQPTAVKWKYHTELATTASLCRLARPFTKFLGSVSTSAVQCSGQHFLSDPERNQKPSWLPCKFGETKNSQSHVNVRSK